MPITSIENLAERLSRLRWIAAYLAFLVLLALAIAVIVPLRPSFQGGTQLDNSWVVGLNEASGLGISMGNGIVFTFGPYASVYTAEYHPATDRLMLFGSLLLALGFAAVLLSFALLKGAGVALVVGLLLLTVFRQNDALLFAYPLLVSIYVFLRYMALPPGRRVPDAPVDLAFLGFIFIPFGLLPLIKGPALMTVAATTLLCAFALMRLQLRREAGIVLLVPAVSCTALWMIAGESLPNLLRFFYNLVPIVSGYSPAMSSMGPRIEIWVYLGGCAVVALAILASNAYSLVARLFLLEAFGLMLFLAFKAGFVRHDAHALIAGAALGIAGSCLALFSTRATALALLVSIGVWAFIDGRYAKTNTEALVNRVAHPFLSLAQGYDLRMGKGERSVLEMAEGQRAALSKECPIEKLEGSVDIYSYRQACLIFSGNAWSPRPVFQSYSAYTPRLAQMNAEHLLGSAAPKNVLFRVEPIDYRLPSLEDGPSWPLLLQLYRPRKLEADLVYLERRDDSPTARRPQFETTVEAKVGEAIAVPAHETLMMARVRLAPTVLGRLTNIAFKSPSPSIVLTLFNGVERRFRFVPGMGAAEFVLSPHLVSTRDFVLLMEGNDDALRSSRVKSFRIGLDKSGDLYWSSSVEVSFSSLRLKPSGTQLAQ